MAGGTAVTAPSSTGVTGSVGQTDKYLTVSLGEARFGIPVSRVKEIIECDAITPLPMAPAAVRGTINLRGRVVPVVDLAVRFGLPSMTIGRRTCIVIAEVDHGDKTRAFDFGLLIDAVNEVVDLAPGDIERAPTMNGSIRTDFALGMGKVRGAFVLLLKIEALVAVAEIESLTSSLPLPLLDSGGTPHG